MVELMKFAPVTSDEWLALLQRSVREPFIDGVEFPRFPHSSVQMQYNGAADEAAMLQAHAFWRLLDSYARALGWPLSGNCQVLDIGCGWGRIARLFAKDVHPAGIHGVDVMPGAVELCRALGVPGTFAVTEPGKPLPFPDGKFSTITAYSVFTHLPEKIATKLVAEMSRVAASGCVMAFTVEDRSFLEKIGWDNLEYHGERWVRLARYKDRLPALLKSFDKGEFNFLATSEDTDSADNTYGDAIVPRAWMKKHWAKYIQLVEVIAAQEPVYEAVVIARKK
jgi:ubiquinone/menaquinone biosynthesis C-methylase UbiE